MELKTGACCGGQVAEMGVQAAGWWVHPCEHTQVWSLGASGLMCPKNGEMPCTVEVREGVPGEGPHVALKGGRRKEQ